MQRGGAGDGVRGGGGGARAALLHPGARESCRDEHRQEPGSGYGCGGPSVPAGASEGTTLPGVVASCSPGPGRPPPRRPTAPAASPDPSRVCPPAAFPKCQPQESSRNPSFPFAWIPIGSQSLITDYFRLPCFSCFGFLGRG